MAQRLGYGMLIKSSPLYGQLMMDHPSGFSSLKPLDFSLDCVPSVPLNTPVHNDRASIIEQLGPRISWPLAKFAWCDPGPLQQDMRNTSLYEQLLEESQPLQENQLAPDVDYVPADEHDLGIEPRVKDDSRHTAGLTSRVPHAEDEFGWVLVPT